MTRLVTRTSIEAVLGLVLALGIGATRTEKLMAEMHASLSHQSGIVFSSIDHAPAERFDPARVPTSGGMAARLLAGISVKHD